MHHLITKQLLKQLLRPLLPLLRQHDRLGFADRIANQPFGVESIQRVPIMPFPGAGMGEFAFALSETCQVQQGEHCVIYFVEVWFHKCDCPVVVRGLTGIFYTLAKTASGCSRRRHRLCENSSPAGDPEKTTSTVSIWRVFFGGEGSENPFFVLPKCHFGVFAQPGQSALASFRRKSTLTD